MSRFSRFRRRPSVHRAATPDPLLHPEESTPLMDRVVQACSWDAPGFTVVREEAETAWVVAMVDSHIDALDEWTADVFDTEIAERHLIRLAQIDVQREARTQEAGRALAEAQAVLTAVTLKVDWLRAREHELAAELRSWSEVLTGVRTDVRPSFATA